MPTNALEYVAYRFSGLNGPQCVQTPAEDTSVLNARSLHSDSLASDHLAVSDGQSAST